VAREQGRQTLRVRASTQHFNVYGDGGIITTLDDLARWDRVFYTGLPSASGLSSLLVNQGRLNNGSELRYAFGLDVYAYKGHRVVEHGGGMLGFTVDMMRFPDERLTVIALANTFEEWSTTMAFRVADLFLPDRSESEPRRPPAIPISEDALRGYTGYYWSRDRNFYRRVELRDGALVLDAGQGTSSAPLMPIGSHRFVFTDNPARQVVFTETPSRARRIVVGTPETGDGFEAEQYDSTPPSSIQEVRPLLGEYRSDELAVTYRFWEKQEQVFFQIGDGKPIEVFPNPAGRMVWNAKDMLWIGFGEVVFRRDNRGRVHGLTIGDQRVSRVFLRRVR
jgi:hypothetical protein